jgi:DNA-binding transcriptional regulator YbjK
MLKGLFPFPENSREGVRAYYAFGLKDLAARTFRKKTQRKQNQLHNLNSYVSEFATRKRVVDSDITINFLSILGIYSCGLDLVFLG